MPMDIGKTKENFDKDGKYKCFNCEIYGHIVRVVNNRLGFILFFFSFPLFYFKFLFLFLYFGYRQRRQDVTSQITATVT